MCVTHTSTKRVKHVNHEKGSGPAGEGGGGVTGGGRDLRERRAPLRIDVPGYFGRVMVDACVRSCVRVSSVRVSSVRACGVKSCGMLFLFVCVFVVCPRITQGITQYRQHQYMLLRISIAESTHPSPTPGRQSPKIILTQIRRELSHTQIGVNIEFPLRRM